MQFARFPTINSILSNGAELRPQSIHVVGIPMQNRTTMTKRDGASELPHSNEWGDKSQDCMPRTPTARGPAVAAFEDGTPTGLKRLGVTGV
jgi:hypothetical protein